MHNFHKSFCYKNPYLLVDKAVRVLKEHGYAQLFEDQEWNNIPSKFFVVRNDLTLVAINKKDLSDALILCGYNDASCLKLKPNTKLSRFGANQVRIAPYGTQNLVPWMDRDLGYAGKILYKLQKENKEDEILEKKVFLSKNTTTVIPSHSQSPYATAPTLNAELNFVPIDNVKLNDSDGLQSSQLMCDLASIVGCKKEEIVDWDVSLIPNEPLRFIGPQKEMAAGYGLSVMASSLLPLIQFVNAKDPQSGMNVLYISGNNQLYGSTRVGSKSNFLVSVFERIGCNDSTYVNAHMVCVDTFDAPNPNLSYHNEPFININSGEGTFLYTQTDRAYISNFNLKVYLNMLAKNANVPLKPITVQLFSTIALDLENNMNVETAVIGIPVIGKNSPRELVFENDFLSLEKLISEYLNNFRSLPEIETQ